MSKAKTFTTLESIYKATPQTSAQQILNEHVYLKGKGWADIKITPELREQVVNMVVEIAGGHTKTKSAMWRTLTYQSPQHWALNRIFVKSFDGKAALRYCAGQDYTYEMGQLRAALK